MNYRRIRVFVASPADVATERDALAGVVNELNTLLTALVPEAAVFVELVRWETHAVPAFGRPQQIINDRLADYDIFVGLMWRRFGTPTGAAGSGTEEEFRIALRRWEEDRQPHIMFYFSNALSPPPASAAEIEQLSRVIEFKVELSTRGLVWQYPDATQFADVVRPHLAAAVGQIIRSPKLNRTDDIVMPRERVQITIIEIAPEDAYFEFRGQLIDRLVTPHTLTITGDGWSGGVVEFDTPPLPTEIDTRISLFRFRWEAQV